MFMEKNPEIEILEDKVRVTLAVPYQYTGMITHIDIPYMTSNHYRMLKGEETHKDGQFEMLMTLTGMSASEIDRLSPADLAGCLGVIRGFFLQFQTTSEIYWSQSARLFLQRAQASLAE